MGSIGAPELLIFLVILLVVFGASRLPKLARSVGVSAKEFKAGLKEGQTAEEVVEGPCPFCKAEVPAEAKFCPGCAKSADEIVAERTRQAAAKSA
jgi:sec-independent protein translocase protein TatA